MSGDGRILERDLWDKDDGRIETEDFLQCSKGVGLRSWGCVSIRGRMRQTRGAKTNQARVILVRGAAAIENRRCLVVQLLLYLRVECQEGEEERERVRRCLVPSEHCDE